MLLPNSPNLCKPNGPKTPRSMRSIFFFLLMTLLGSVSVAESLPAQFASTQVKAASSDAADLTFFNRKVFTFRAPLIGVSAHDRAKRAQARIVDQLSIAGPHVAATKPDLLGYQVHINGAAIFWVSPADRDPAREDSLDATALKAAAALQQAINDSAEARNLEALLRALGLAALATVVAAAVGWAASRVHRLAARVLTAATEKHAGQLQVGGVIVLHGGRLSTAVQWLVALLYRVLLLVLFVEWLSYVMRCFAFTRAWGESLNAFLVGLATRMLGAAIDAVPDLLAALLIFVLAYWLTKALDRFFTNVQNNTLHVHWLDSDVVVPTKRIAKVVVWLFALAMA